jgi:hypothetical protein
MGGGLVSRIASLAVAATCVMGTGLGCGSGSGSVDRAPLGSGGGAGSSAGGTGGTSEDPAIVAMQQTVCAAGPFASAHASAFCTTAGCADGGWMVVLEVGLAECLSADQMQVVSASVRGIPLSVTLQEVRGGCPNAQGCTLGNLFYATIAPAAGTVLPDNLMTPNGRDGFTAIPSAENALALTLVVRGATQNVTFPFSDAAWNCSVPQFTGDCEPAVCVPNCGTFQCGDDTCGGSCGVCPTGYTCGHGHCGVSSTCTAGCLVNGVCCGGAFCSGNCVGTPCC